MAEQREWLSADEVAEVLNVPLRTVVDWRYRRVGPPSVRLGRRVRYSRAGLEKWTAKEAADRAR